MNFHDKCILVTGASSGIGLATAQHLAGQGARIIGVARDAARLDAALASLPGSGHASVATDLSTEDGRVAVREFAKGHEVQLSGAALCAGTHWLRPFKLLNESLLDEMLRSHVHSSILLTRELAFGRVTAPEGLAVVWLGSVAALRGEVAATAYAAAKAALIAAARCLAKELARRKMRLNVVSPGVVQTPQSEAYLGSLPEAQRRAIEAAHPLGIGQPEDVAQTIAFLLSPAARWITGENLVIDGGLSL